MFIIYCWLMGCLWSKCISCNCVNGQNISLTIIALVSTKIIVVITQDNLANLKQLLFSSWLRFFVLILWITEIWAFANVCTSVHKRNNFKPVFVKIGYLSCETNLQKFSLFFSDFSTIKLIILKLTYSNSIWKLRWLHCKSHFLDIAVLIKGSFKFYKIQKLILKYLGHSINITYLWNVWNQH